MQNEVVLATLPSEHADQRVLLVMQAGIDGTRFEMRQQTWGKGVGWFTQSTVSLDAHQLSDLKQSLRATSSRPRSFTARESTFEPRVIRAESA